jgi:hypothetical protein
LRAASVAITAPGDSAITGILPRSAGVLENLPETAGNLAIATPRVSQAETDERLLELWLHGRSALTVEAYGRDVGDFLEAVQKPIRSLTIADLQGWVDLLKGAPATRAAPAGSGQVAAQLRDADRLCPVQRRRRRAIAAGGFKARRRVDSGKFGASHLVHWSRMSDHRGELISDQGNHRVSA